jgi:4-hydroxythreonine-4-phosphate dehydrogenase
VAVKAAWVRKKQYPIVLVGDWNLVLAQARALGLAETMFVELAAVDTAMSAGKIGVWAPARALASKDRIAGKPTDIGGRAQLAWVDAATRAVAARRALAIVTGPVNKHVIVRAGAAKFRGHTEHIARLTGATEVVMAFYAEAFSSALVTTHLPLAKVPRAITPAAVARTCYWLAQLVLQTTVPARNSSLSGSRSSLRIAVAGLNPHAGENGLLGSEESRISAGIELARARLGNERRKVTLVGPVPSESAFRLANDGVYRGVVAMYHDQATIPMKLCSFGDAVNVSLGLPIVRTSVDHGTGYDIAGKGVADADGMVAAIDLGAELALRAV